MVSVHASKEWHLRGLVCPQRQAPGLWHCYWLLCQVLHDSPNFVQTAASLKSSLSWSPSCVSIKKCVVSRRGLQLCPPLRKGVSCLQPEVKNSPWKSFWPHLAHRQNTSQIRNQYGAGAVFLSGSGSLVFPGSLLSLTANSKELPYFHCFSRRLRSWGQGCELKEPFWGQHCGSVLSDFV